MAGKRILDVAKLIQATRAVTRQHVALRSEQLDRFNKTSTVAKEVKYQTERITLTVGAAVELAKRFAEEEEKQPWQEEVVVETQAPQHAEQKEASTVRTTAAEQPKQPEPEPEITAEPVSQPAQPQDVHPLAASDINTIPIETIHDAQAEEDAAELIHPDKPTSNYELRESRVPSTRLGRLWQYGGLATSMAFGAVGESLRRVTGGEAAGSLMLSPGNMERLVAKLSRMRGAALKLGQMVSFQGEFHHTVIKFTTNRSDLKMLPPEIHEVLQRVQDRADYMPPSQRDQVLASNLGSEWRFLFSRFDEVPIAAASIGQVHKAIYRPTGQEVAVKVQYPGVAKSIDSDLNNLSVLLTASRLLPRGLFLDRTIANARTELGWECDYLREAQCAKQYKKFLHDDTEVFTVPKVIDDASGKEVLTAEYMSGTAVTKLPNLSQHDRDWIGTNILRLCLREICEFKFMQTDPNWTNFLFNGLEGKLELLDFGATRSYPDKFIIPYVGVLRAASVNDRETVRELSIQLGYLTGTESKAMSDAHVDSVVTLAEPFGESAPDVYDFRDQTITDRVRSLIPLMLRERLAPPPEETYSLHRKLSGAFLLCAKLGSQVKCKEMFRTAINKFDRRT
jgi:aarF domain-containing kinase